MEIRQLAWCWLRPREGEPVTCTESLDWFARGFSLHLWCLRWFTDPTMLWLITCSQSGSGTVVTDCCCSNKTMISSLKVFRGLLTSTFCRVHNTQRFRPCCINRVECDRSARGTWSDFDEPQWPCCQCDRSRWSDFENNLCRFPNHTLFDTVSSVTDQHVT